ncbi:acylphosphatase [Candidatus Woesearchaeota archaeon]|nr:acylphosphatase [Candidatus Woesearchaeota archaeon]
MQTRVTIKVKGSVQGVFFRQYVKDFADKLRLKGMVRNLLSGEVEVIAEGEESDLRSLVKACHEGPKGALIDDIQVIHEQPTGEFKSFRVSF